MGGRTGIFDVMNLQRALIAFLLALAALWSLGGGARAQQQERQIDHEAEYRACMLLTRSDPNAALEAAAAWARVGGGDPAKHCGAAARVVLGQYPQAAEELEALAKGLTQPIPELQSEMMRQAAQAWTLAGNDARALQAQNEGLRMKEDNVELRIDRAVTLATRDRIWEAIDDLNRASEISPGRADVLIYRASAYRQLGEVEFAMEDAERALAIDPGNPEGLLERGLLNQALGNEEAARADWQRIVLLVPGTPAADIAQRNLEILDGVAQPPAQ